MRLPWRRRKVEPVAVSRRKYRVTINEHYRGGLSTVWEWRVELVQGAEFVLIGSGHSWHSRAEATTEAYQRARTNAMGHRAATVGVTFVFSDFMERTDRPGVYWFYC